MGGTVAREEPVGDLEIGRDVAFQHRQWAAQRVAWLGMAVVLLAALAGLLGAGPLSDASARAGPLSVEYGRFERRHAPEVLELEVAPGAARDGQVEVWLATDWLETIELHGVVPEPAEVRAEGDRTVFAVGVVDSGQPITVLVSFEHDAAGFAEGRAGLVDGPELRFWQIVYP